MRRSGRRGFNLLELVVVITILAVLLAVGIPQYRRHLANAALRSAVDTLVGKIHRARTVATTGSVAAVPRPGGPQATAGDSFGLSLLARLSPPPPPPPDGCTPLSAVWQHIHATSHHNLIAVPTPGGGSAAPPPPDSAGSAPTASDPQGEDSGAYAIWLRQNNRDAAVDGVVHVPAGMKIRFQNWLSLDLVPAADQAMLIFQPANDQSQCLVFLRSGEALVPTDSAAITVGNTSISRTVTISRIGDVQVVNQ